MCRKLGCWSTNNTAEERERVYRAFNQYFGGVTVDEYHQFLVNFEGMIGSPVSISENTLQPNIEVDALLAEMSKEKIEEY